MKFNINYDDFDAYDLKGYVYNGLEILDNNHLLLIRYTDDSYKILDYPQEKISNMTFKDLNIPIFTADIPLNDKRDIILNSIFKDVQPTLIYEAMISLNYNQTKYIYSFSQTGLDKKISKTKVDFLKEYRQELLLKNTFSSKLKAIETIYVELKLNSSDREDNLENLALESFVDNFIKGFDEDAGVQMISSGRSSSLLNRNDKDQLSEIQRKYFELIDSDPDITYKKLEEFSASLFSIHREGIRHYKKLKRD